MRSQFSFICRRRQNTVFLFGLALFLIAGGAPSRADLLRGWTQIPDPNTFQIDLVSINESTGLVTAVLCQLYIGPDFSAESLTYDPTNGRFYGNLQSGQGFQENRLAEISASPCSIMTHPYSGFPPPVGNQPNVLVEGIEFVPGVGLVISHDMRNSSGGYPTRYLSRIDHQGNVLQTTPLLPTINDQDELGANACGGNIFVVDTNDPTLLLNDRYAVTEWTGDPFVNPSLAGRYKRLPPTLSNPPVNVTGNEADVAFDPATNVLYVTDLASGSSMSQLKTFDLATDTYSVIRANYGHPGNISGIAAVGQCLCQLPSSQTVDCSQLQPLQCAEPAATTNQCFPMRVLRDSSGNISAHECDCIPAEDFCHVETQPNLRCEGVCDNDLNVQDCPDYWEPVPQSSGDFIFSCCCPGEPVDIDLTTGVQYNTFGEPELILPGSPDDTWRVKPCTPPGPLTGPEPVVVDPDPSWSLLPPSQWISSGLSGPNGDYCYETCFCLEGNFQGVSLSFDLLAEDTATVYVNRGSNPAPVLSTTAPSHINPMHFPDNEFNMDSLFHAGDNCIEVVVHKTDGGSTGFSFVGGFAANKGLCCPCPLALSSPDDLCAPLQKRDCNANGAGHICRPKRVKVVPMRGLDPPPAISVTECDCIADGACGAVIIQKDPISVVYTLSCTGACPNFIFDRCEVHVDGVSQGQASIVATNSLLGKEITCGCTRHCDDDIFCNGRETTDPSTGECVAGVPPCEADFLCDEEQDACLVITPTVSQWGLVVLALLLLAGAKVCFGRRVLRVQ
ncbi:MAG: hypothetical protein HY763_09500 [Planctomycetes bacterium]|nr:hypothetical protein [Planctomycetota bacterium]